MKMSSCLFRDFNASSQSHPEITVKGAVKQSRSTKDPDTSLSDPRCRLSQRRRNDRQTDSNHHEKLNTSMFQSYLENLWSKISVERRSSFTFLDCLWFHLYKDESRKIKVLDWIKKRTKIFSTKYVFVPIICWHHWSLLILCHFGETRQPKAKKTCMLLLDSLHAADPKRMEPDIRRFVLNIYKSEGRREKDDFISKIPLRIPKVPQQTNGEDCGLFVLYFIYLFVQNATENFNVEGYPYFLTEDWFSLEDLESFRKEIHSFGCMSGTYHQWLSNYSHIRHA